MRFHFLQKHIQLPAADAPYITIGHFYNAAIGSTVFGNVFEVYDMAFVYANKLVSIQYVFKIL